MLVHDDPHSVCYAAEAANNAVGQVALSVDKGVSTYVAAAYHSMGMNDVVATEGGGTVPVGEGRCEDVPAS